MASKEPKPLTGRQVLDKLQSVGDDLADAPVGSEARLKLLREQADLGDQRAAQLNPQHRGT